MIGQAAFRCADGDSKILAARGHWAIENGLQWLLEIPFNDDRDRARQDNAPENLSILRELALNMLKKARPEISRRRKRSGWSDLFARAVLGQMR